MTEPIRPEDVYEAKAKSMPDEVIEAFNQLIAENWDGTSSTFSQDNAVKRICQICRWTPRYVYEQRYLDVEDIFEKAGWKVEYDKAGFNESYPATFTFSIRRRGKKL